MAVKELVAALDGRISRNAIYNAIHNGEIPHVRIGRRILFPADVLDRILAAQSDTGPPTDFVLERQAQMEEQAERGQQ